MFRSITEPTLLINKDIVESNIDRMAKKASSNNLKFRPHFKTHQSIAVAELFKNVHLDGITVSSIKMAQYFADNGWNSITIAFPVNTLEINAINELAANIDLRVLVVNIESLQKLEETLTSPLRVYIELDPDYGRSGVSITDYNTIELLLNTIQKSSNIIFSGFYMHAGHSYNSRSSSEIQKLADSILTKINTLVSKFNYPVCYGDTPTCSVLNDFRGITEISPGNFVFYDWIQTQIGSCSINDIAIAMACPVVAKYESRNELLIHGGAVHFSKDFDRKDDDQLYYGQVVRHNLSKWDKIMDNCYLKSVSQEHGIVRCTPQFFSETNIGDIVTILPIHSCLTADLMGRYFTLEGKEIDHLSKNYK